MAQIKLENNDIVSISTQFSNEDNRYEMILLTKDSSVAEGIHTMLQFRANEKFSEKDHIIEFNWEIELSRVRITGNLLEAFELMHGSKLIHLSYITAIESNTTILSHIKSTQDFKFPDNDKNTPTTSNHANSSSPEIPSTDCTASSTIEEIEYLPTSPIIKVM